MKRRVCCILLVLALLCIAPAGAFAESSASSSPVAAGLLSIDNGNVYAGMAKSYSQGYVPGINTGTATVVFPLVPSGDIQNSRINVTVGLGDASSSPFVFGNYDQTIGLQNNPVNNGAGNVSSYLVNLTLPMVDSRIMGRYPVTIRQTTPHLTGLRFHRYLRRTLPFRMARTRTLRPRRLPLCPPKRRCRSQRSSSRIIRSPLRMCWPGVPLIWRLPC